MQAALHHTVVVVDVVGFGDRARTNEHQMTVRAGLYSALRGALDEIGVPWSRCAHEDRGDGVFVLVPSDIPKALFVENFPRELATAVRAHNAERRPEEQIRLRLALHAGEILHDEHGSTGAALNLAFRLIDAPALKTAFAKSNGVLGIIVSSWFYEEVVRHSAASEPATYRQVRVEVKETDTSAWIRVPDLPPARGNARRTLPRDKAEFTGRHNELAYLLAHARASLGDGQGMAVHVIDGMAGVGKTALAVHLAHRLADSFPDGQLFVPLHAHTPGQQPADPTDVLCTLLSAAGVSAQHIPAGVDARAAMWRDHLVGRKVLLVLDDAAGHQQVEPLLPASDGCLVLVTSRRRLTALDTVVTLSLDTLPPDEAMALFARQSDRQVDEADAAHVAEIVRLAGYLPLAISLVASRLRHRRTWSIADLANDLSSTRGRLLEIRAEDVAVVAAFDLSYRNLPVNQQRFFCHLGLHPGPELDVYGAAALAGVPAVEASEHLDSLYDDHLLDESAHGRYRMHDLIRDYSRMRITQDLPGAEGEAVTRLMKHYQQTARLAEDRIYGRDLSDQDTAPSMDGIVDVSTALAWLHAERANLVACVDYAAQHGHRQQLIGLQDALTSFLWVIGPWDQAILLQRPGNRPRHDPPSRAYALSRLGEELRKAGDFSGAIEAHTRALEIYRSLDLPELRKRMANTLSFLGIARLAIGDVRGAIDAQMQALEIFRPLDYPLAEAYVLNELGLAYRTMGDLTEAAQAHERALDIFRAVGGELGEAFALFGLGSVRRVAGEVQEAINLQRKALEIYRAAHSRVGEADALDELGAAVGATGDLPGAEELHARALEIYQELSHSLGQAETHNNRGVLLRQAGDPAGGIEEHRSALRLALEVHSSLEEARALEGMAYCELDLGQTPAALSHLRAADSIYERIGATTAAARTTRHLAGVPAPRTHHDR